MKTNLFLAVFVCPFFCFAAKDVEKAKVDGEYRAERDANEPALTIELRNGAITGKLTTHDPEKPNGPPSEVPLKGEYLILRDVVTLRFDRVTCKLRYTEENGAGLELIPAAGKRPALCKNSFKKEKSLK